jgi:hypothetical protein
MSYLPSDDSFRLELNSLSNFLYECIDMEGDLAPTRDEWDNLRNSKWAQSRYLLKVFGLPVNARGWRRLVEEYGYRHPTFSETMKAAYARIKEANPYPSYYQEDESYPELLGTSVRQEVYHEDLGDGTKRVWTRTYTSLR